MCALKISFHIKLWHVLLIGTLLAIATWWWFDQQIHQIDTKLEIMQNQ